MPLPLTIPPRQTHKSLLNAPVVTDLDAIDARIAFLGIPSGDPYSIDEVTNGQTIAPTAVPASDRQLLPQSQVFRLRFLQPARRWSEHQDGGLRAYN